MQNRNVHDIYRLTPLQKAVLSACLQATGSSPYVVQMACKLEGPIDVGAFQSAWAALMARHETLRSSFMSDGFDEPLRVVHAEVPVPWEQLDVSTLSASEQTARLRALMAEHRRMPFDPAHAPLMRCALLRISPIEHEFVWTYHHLILDGWSSRLVLEDLRAFYGAVSRGEAPPLMPAPQFGQYVVWMDRQDQAAVQDYWRSVLDGVVAATPFPSSPASKLVDDNHEFRQTVPAEASERLRRLARDQRVTVSTLVNGAWAIVLGRLTGQPTVCFGTVVSGRSNECVGVESMVGLLANTLPTCVRLRWDEDVPRFLARLQRQQHESRRYESTPLDVVQACSNCRSGPLFETVVAVENYPTASLQPLSGGSRIVNARVAETRAFPFGVVVSPGVGLDLLFSFAPSRIDLESVREIANRFAAVLVALAEQPNQALQDLRWLSDADERQILVDSGAWRATIVGDEPAAIDVFEMRAATRADAVAILGEGQRLTYRQLDRTANALALELTREGVGAEVPVCVAVSDPVTRVVAFLAILKAGGVYVPVDPMGPPSRNLHIYRDAQPGVVIASDGCAPPPGPWSIVTVAPSTYSVVPHPPPRPSPSPAQLAYVLYTSGSSGVAKGVMVSLQGIVNVHRQQLERLGVAESDVVLQVASPLFDAWIFEVIMALWSGATLAVAGRGQPLLGGELAGAIESSRATVLTIVPSVLASLPERPLPSLRTIVCAGEALPRDLVRRWSRDRQMFNAYGPTESTIWATAAECDPDQLTPPIGGRIEDVGAYVLDGQQRVTPWLAPGELYLDGCGLARGYLGRPDLTAERFLPNPFSLRPGGRMYRTGDVVTRRLDGALEFRGRTDDQVKMRGCRVELGEIEVIARGLPGVQRAAAIVRGKRGTEPEIVLFVSGAASTVTPTAIRQALKHTLPDYMMPGAIHAVEELPLTVSGKVDRAALSTLSSSSALAPTILIEVFTSTERALAGIWSDVLGDVVTSADVDFFELGGHSLAMTRVAAHIQRDLGLEIPLADLFEHTTLGGIAREVDRRLADRAAGPPAVSARAGQ